MDTETFKRRFIEERDRDAKARKVSQATNFCRVFELPAPEEFPEDYCFGGGIPVMIKMVDWFHPVDRGCVTSFGPRTWEEAKKMLPNYIRGKTYFNPARRYLILTDFNETLLID
jgi:hypothetical protein